MKKRLSNREIEIVDLLTKQLFTLDTREYRYYTRLYNVANQLSILTSDSEFADFINGLYADFYLGYSLAEIQYICNTVKTVNVVLKGEEVLLDSLFIELDKFENTIKSHFLGIDVVDLNQTDDY